MPSCWWDYLDYVLYTRALSLSSSVTIYYAQKFEQSSPNINVFSTTDDAVNLYRPTKLSIMPRSIREDVTRMLRGKLLSWNSSLRLNHWNSRVKRLIFVDIEVKNNLHSNKTTAKTVLSVIGKLSGQFFIFKQDIARRTAHARQSTFLPAISPSVKPIFKKISTPNLAINKLT